MRPARASRAAVVGLTLALAVGCTADAERAAAPASAAPPASTGAPSAAAPAPTADQVTAAQVRADGVPLTSGDVTVRVLATAPATVTVTPDDDGSARATTTPGTVHVAAPDGAGLVVLGDGTALVTATPGEAPGDAPAAGATGDQLPGDEVAGLSGGRATAVSPDLVRVDAPAGATLWLAARTVEATAWGDREGGESLAVTPSAWARASGAAAERLTWTQLVALEPRADSPTMRDQLSCHQLGAPDKATWNLEPWRPDVGWLSVVAARCNPE